MRSQCSIVVVIPALNEDASLPRVLARIPLWIDRVLVVDNGSTDATAAVARAGGATVVSEPRRGYGRACLAGIAAAQDADILVFIDADGSDSPEQMQRLVQPVLEGRADIVIGSRIRGNCERGAMTLTQRFGNVLATTLIRTFWSVSFTDLGPFRAIRAAALRQLEMDDETYGWTVQMQIRAARFGLGCAEVPVDYARRSGGKSKVSGTARGVMLAATKILTCIARERWWPRRHRPQSAECLAVFAKQPRAGHSKTRLIPALGAQGAADLHRQMVDRTLERVNELRRRRDIACEVWHTERQNEKPPDWIGGLPAHPQVEGDLGERMLHAFQSMLRRASAAIIIGTDCPELSVDELDAALEALSAHDLVIGPASDGGYYLIGLRRPVPGLFKGMTWSDGGVLEQTLRRARDLGLRIHLLPVHDDIDEPKDLHVWARATTRKQASADDSPLLTVVIPTLNEEHTIANAMASVRREGVEIIVSDGGSTDDTRTIAAARGARVVHSAPGRGPQLNAGAALARADSLMFLHADTTPPAGFLEIILRSLSDESTAIGAFRFSLDRRGGCLRLIECAVHLRCALFAAPYGDQALFLRTSTFRTIGGFEEIPLMEDFALVRSARSLGRVRVVKACAVTSSRRWSSGGVIQTTLINQLCILAFLLGVSPSRLARWRNGGRPGRLETVSQRWYGRLARTSRTGQRPVPPSHAAVLKQALGRTARGNDVASDGFRGRFDAQGIECCAQPGLRCRDEEIHEPILPPDVDVAGVRGCDVS